MPNLKKLVLMSGLSATLAAVALTGCSMLNHQEGERTAGRTLDDKSIQADVKHNLNKDPLYKFADVDVKTFNGVVQLSGFVNTEEQKRRAQEVTQQVPGVQQVVNNITLKPPGNNPLSPTSRDQRNTTTDPNNR
jgi:hyperosmotically inducible protein